MSPTITAFANSPDEGRGQARDMRVRWAFEEVGQPYDVRLVPWAGMKQPAHLALQPFGQIPTYEEGDLVLFDSGAIVLHIADQHAGLLPKDANARVRAITWMFTAVSTMEPVIVDREVAEYTENDRSWYEARLAGADTRISNRMRELSRRLGDADWLDGGFSAGDLMMVMVLRRLNGSPLLTGFATSPPMSRGARRGRRSDGRSRPSWRCSRRPRPRSSPLFACVRSQPHRPCGRGGCGRCGCPAPGSHRRL